MFKKEDKKDREVQGGADLSTGVYIKRYMRSGKASQRASTGGGDFYVAHTTWATLVEVPFPEVSFLPDFLNIHYKVHS
ncbi:hypothetical protein J11TS1_17350 [Oceanobacillus sp. J11TS1]|nr:hypothetical protein J11TS1_17350 [Oceanobacillus sp. J11TS1]